MLLEVLHTYMRTVSPVSSTGISKHLIYYLRTILMPKLLILVWQNRHQKAGQIIYLLVWWAHLGKSFFLFLIFLNIFIFWEAVNLSILVTFICICVFWDGIEWIFRYVAPEYAMTGHLLVKSDVYSYGVVLLELLTGRKPVDMSQPNGQENLVTWVRTSSHSTCLYKAPFCFLCPF